MTPSEVPPSLPPAPPPHPSVHFNPHVRPQTSGAAVASLVCGFLGLLMCCCCPFPVLSVAGIICGHLALSHMHRNPFLQGRELAVFGLILGYLAVVVAAVIMGTSLVNPELYRQFQDRMERAKQELQHQEKPKDLPADAI